MAVGRGRRWVVSGLVMVMVGGHLVAALRDVELWPFSRYALYDKRFNPGTHRQLGLYGVTLDGAEFRLDDRHFDPLDAGRLRKTLWRVFPKDADGVRPGDALPAWLRYYDRRRELGLHDGPELVAIRLYREHRTYPPNPDRLVGWPDGLDFLAEHARDGITLDPPPPYVRPDDLGRSEARR